MNPYLAVEVGWLRHPKVRKVHRDARSLWIAGGLHAVEHETDGVIEKHMLGILAAEADVKPSRAVELVEAGLWEDWGDRYVMHDFLDRNPSKEQKEALREKWRKQKENQRGVPPMSTADTAQDTHTDTAQESTTLLSSTKTNTKPRSKHLIDVPSIASVGFDEFWTCYPRKIGKPAAQKAYARAMRTADIADVRYGLRVWCQHWQTVDQQFVPHPATWLNREGWNDQPPPPAKPNSRPNEGLDYLLAKMTAPTNGAIEQ